MRFLVKVKLKSKANLPFLNLIPPNIHEAGKVVFSYKILGVLTIDDFRIVFDAQAKIHPKYLDDTWTLDTVLTSFLDAFDTPGKKDGKVTLLIQ